MNWVIAGWCGDGGLEVVFNEEVSEVVLWGEA